MVRWDVINCSVLVSPTLAAHCHKITKCSKKSPTEKVKRHYDGRVAFTPIPLKKLKNGNICHHQSSISKKEFTIFTHWVLITTLHNCAHKHSLFVTQPFCSQSSKLHLILHLEKKWWRHFTVTFSWHSIAPISLILLLLSQFPLCWRRTTFKRPEWNKLFVKSVL